MYQEPYSQDPYGGYGGYAPTGPRSFGELPSLWLKFFQMTEDFFRQELPRAGAMNTFLSVLVMSLVGSIIAAVMTLVMGAVQTAIIPEDMRGMVGGLTGLSGFSAFCGGLFGGIIGFYLGNALMYISAKLFGGTGSFDGQAYLVSLISVPMGILGGLVGFIPYLGSLAGLGLSIYSIVLNVRALKVAHNLTTGKAVGAIFLPIIVFTLLVGSLIALFVALAGPEMGDLFQEMLREMEQPY